MGSLPSEPVRGAHIPALDAVRGIAILLVTAFRFTLAAGDPPAPHPVYRVLALGEHGVDLCFVLSGFLITGILYDAKGEPHYFRNFYMCRTLRILPLYYGVLFLAFVVLPLAPSPAGTLFREVKPDQAWLWLYSTKFLQAWRGSGCWGRSATSGRSRWRNTSAWFGRSSSAYATGEPPCGFVPAPSSWPRPYVR
jgi:peptidoglycan/LPS O-acetylase OafA/YrhL